MGSFESTLSIKSIVCKRHSDTYSDTNIPSIFFSGFAVIAW